MSKPLPVVVTADWDGNWHKVVALFLHKFRKELGPEVVITTEDIAALGAMLGGPNVLVRSTSDALYVRLVSDEELKDVAKVRTIRGSGSSG